VNICLGCHSDIADLEKKPVHHQPVFVQGCAICHQPHGSDNEHLLRAADTNKLCLECHGPDSKPQKLESDHLVAIFGGKIRLPENYFAKVPILPLKYNLGHPVDGHPVSNVMDPTDVTKVKTPMNCLTCHQPHASLQPVLLALASPSFAQKKKKDAAPQPKVSVLDRIDTSKIVWPNPPNITRIKYLNYFAGEKLPDFSAKRAKSKSAWMDRLAGATEKGDDPLKNHFFMGEPHGLAFDSNGKLYVADGKVRAIFIIDPETRDTEMIKNGKDAAFKLIVGLAIDDTDRLFVSDAGSRTVLVFGPNHKAEAAIREGLNVPAG